MASGRGQRKVELDSTVALTSTSTSLDRSRSMDIHEYQAKELLAGFGVPMPRGGVAYSPEQAVYRAAEIGGDALGGQGADPLRRPRQGRRHQALRHRGRGPPGRQGAAGQAAGHRTRPGPRAASCIASHRAAVPIERELYLGFVLDRKRERIMVVASRRAAWRSRRSPSASPTRSCARSSSRRSGMQAFQARELAFGLGLGAGAGESGRHDAARRLPRLPRPRRHDGGDQSAGGHRRTASCWRSTPR